MFRYFVVAVLLSMSVLARAFAVKSSVGVGVFSGSLLTSLKRTKCDASSTTALNAATIDISTNPLTDKSRLPPFRQIKTEFVLPAVESDLNKLKNDFKGNSTPKS
jgi:hypothetical protein